MLGTGLRYFVTVILGMTASMAIAYGLVRALTANTTLGEPASSAAVERAWDLRACANDLTRLANAFTDAVPTPATPVVGGTARWLRTEFQAELNAVHDALSKGELLDLPSTRDLLEVCTRMSAMAMHPDDAALRGAVFAELRRALDALDAYLRESGLRARIALPVTPLR